MKLILIALLLSAGVTHASDHRIKFSDLLHDFCFYEAYHIDYKECKVHIRGCVSKIILRPDNSRQTHSRKVMKAYRSCIEDV